MAFGLVRKDSSSSMRGAGSTGGNVAPTRSPVDENPLRLFLRFRDGSFDPGCSVDFCVRVLWLQLQHTIQYLLRWYHLLDLHQKVEYHQVPRHGCLDAPSLMQLDYLLLHCLRLLHQHNSSQSSVQVIPAH